MKKEISSLALGVVLIGLGLVMRYALADVEIPVFGMRQLGLVLMVCGVLDAVVAAWALVTRLRS